MKASKVWVIYAYSYGEVYVYDEDTDPMKIPFVEEEIENLLESEDEEFIEEAEEFADNITLIKKNGYGSCEIIERFSIELVETKHYE